MASDTEDKTEGKREVTFNDKLVSLGLEMSSSLKLDTALGKYPSSVRTLEVANLLLVKHGFTMTHSVSLSSRPGWATSSTIIGHKDHPETIHTGTQLPLYATKYPGKRRKYTSPPR